MPLVRCFVKRFVVLFSDYYIFSRRLVSHAPRRMGRAFQSFQGLRDLSMLPEAQGHWTLVGDISRGLRP